VNISDLTERELVARIQQHLPPPPPWMIVGIGDDAAVVEPERNRLEVLSVDAIVEGVHFDRRFTPPDAIGHRALAVNLSDLAAMGAEPRLALLSMALPPALTCDEFDRIAAGLAALAARHKLHVAGGNLTQSPGPIVIDVTVMGTVKRRQVLTRSGARPGDEVYVSGAIGGASSGLRLLKNATTEVTDTNEGGHGKHLLENSDLRSSTVSSVVEHLINRYLYPEPRVRLGLLLGRNRAASACVDLSDGLADGLHQLARASGVGVAVDAASLPIDPAAREAFGGGTADAVAESITRGDDYELLFTVRPRLSSRLRSVCRHSDVPLTKIGVCTPGSSLMLRRPGGDEPVPPGYSHFR
jgi:thiamine-monophosphate kinase